MSTQDAAALSQALAEYRKSAAGSGQHVSWEAAVAGISSNHALALAHPAFQTLQKLDKRIGQRVACYITTRYGCELFTLF
jgi:hypothetical protein